MFTLKVNTNGRGNKVHPVKEYSAFIIVNKASGDMKTLLCGADEDFHTFLIDISTPLGAEVYECDTLEDFLDEWADSMVLLRAYDDMRQFEISFAERPDFSE